MIQILTFNPIILRTLIPPNNKKVNRYFNITIGKRNFKGKWDTSISLIPTQTSSIFIYRFNSFLEEKKDISDKRIINSKALNTIVPI